MTTQTRPEARWMRLGITLTYGTTTYNVERNMADDGSAPNIAYMLYGPRGASYGLMRNVHTPHMLFPINGRRFTGTTPFRGSWFTDEHGLLEVI